MKTVLHFAVYNKDEVMVANLLNDGADPNIADTFEVTALADAIEAGSTVIAKLLI